MRQLLYWLPCSAHPVLITRDLIKRVYRYPSGRAAFLGPACAPDCLEPAAQLLLIARETRAHRELTGAETYAAPGANLNGVPTCVLPCARTQWVCCDQAGWHSKVLQSWQGALIHVVSYLQRCTLVEYI